VFWLCLVDAIQPALKGQSLDHGFAEMPGRNWIGRMQISGSQAAGQALFDGAFHLARLLFKPHGMTQQHGCAQDRADRVGDSFPGDIGC